jgi:hypothetical protein
MPDFGIFRGFNDKLFGNKLYAGQLPTQLGKIGSESFGFIGLLDDYPNAAAAYSLRLLRVGYTGSAIRVRRASDNTEQNIGFINGELDVATLESFCSGTNGFVTTWYDQSGNARDATQTTAANQPQIVSSGSVITDNGKPSILINSTKNSNSSTRLQTQQFTLLQPFTIFSIATAYDVSDLTQQVTDNRSSTATAQLAVQGNNSSYSIYGGSVFAYKSPATNGSAIHYGLFNSSNSQAGYNGSSTNGNSGTNNADGLTIGNIRGIGSVIAAGWIWVGSIFEIVVYADNQSSNRSGIETNINDFYSIY